MHVVQVVHACVCTAAITDTVCVVHACTQTTHTKKSCLQVPVIKCKSALELVRLGSKRMRSHVSVVHAIHRATVQSGVSTCM
jgi:hypothetical protein